MKVYRNVALTLVIIAFVLVGGGCLYYKIMLEPTSNDNIEIEIEIPKGSSVISIANVLKEKDLIKNKTIFRLYTKLNGMEKMKAGTYKLNKNMGVEKIVSRLIQGSAYNPDAISITFAEGLNMRKIASIIEKNTNNKADDVFTLLNDEKYIDELIENYWFLSKNIKDKDIYYPLEGYLFPETYIFDNKDVSVKVILERMLKEFNIRISKYKNDIDDIDLSIHELITLASIVELEGAGSNDRAGVAGVFYNRLNKKQSLGSDVTTYYAIKSDNYKKDLYDKDLKDCSNKYNTRCVTYIGLPIGPISNPGIDSIESTLNPTKHSYYYFVADKNKKTYFTKTITEHNKIIQELKSKGLWIQYEG